MPNLSGHIWTVSRDPGITVQLRDVIKAETSANPRLCATLRDLADAMAASSDVPSAVFVDITPDPRAMLNQLDAVIAQHPRDRFIVVADHFSRDLMIEAMNVGARHYVAKGSLGDELPRVLDRLATTPALARDAGRGGLVTILSAGGGCGATTIAINLADALTAQDGRALLVDLDSAYGGVAAYLGLQGQFGLADVLTPRQHIDPQLLASTAMSFTDSIDALLNPISIAPQQPASMDEQRLEAALDVASLSYAWTIVDAPRIPTDLAVRLTRMSRMTCIVCQLNVKDLRFARELRKGLLAQGVDEASLLFLLSRHRRRWGLVTEKEARQVLGEARLMPISNDYAAASKALNLGHRLSTCAPRSRLRRDIAALADVIAAARPAATEGHGVAPRIAGRLPGLAS